MKKWYTTLAAAMTLGLSAWALSADFAGEVSADNMPAKRERVRRARSEVRAPQAGPARVKGGTDGTKQLYGFGSSASYDGMFTTTPGPVAIAKNAKHQRIATQKMDVISAALYEGNVITASVDRLDNIGKVTYTTYVASFDIPAKAWEGGTQTFTYISGIAVPTDLTYDPESRRIYGCFVNDMKNYGKGKPCSLGYIDPANFNPLEGPTIVGEIEYMRGLTAMADGTIYGISWNGTLYEINKHNATTTSKGKIDFTNGGTIDYGASPSDGPCIGLWLLESAEADYDTGDIYFSFNDDYQDGHIIKFKPENPSSVTRVFRSMYDYSENEEVFSAIFFNQRVAAKTAPAKVENLEISPIGTELKAAVKFTMPNKDTDDKDISGQLNWKISDGTNDLLTGSADAGTEVNKTVTLTAEGFNNIVVTAMNGSSASAPVSQRIFAGPDTPYFYGIPETTVEGLDVTISWEEPFSVNGGNMAPLTYKVVRNPGATVVAEAATGLSVVDHLTSEYKTIYSYDVTPTAGSKTGETKTGRRVAVGPLFNLPHSDEFTDEVIFNEYPVIDANKDNNSWYLNTTKNRAVYSANNNDANDYLCIGPFEMIAGNSYDFEALAGGHSANETVAVYVGNDPKDATSFSTEIVEPTICSPSIGDELLKGSFVPSVSGRYYFGIKACSSASTQNLYLYHVKVNGVTSDSPAAPTDLTFTSTSDELTLHCTLPAKTLGGETPVGVNKVKVFRDNALIAEVTENVADGAKFTYVDKDQVKDGEHLYAIVAVSDRGEGKSATIKTWNGTDTPGRPTSVRTWNDLNDPTIVHFTWTAPEKGVHGGYINPNELTYFVDYMTLSGASGVANAGNNCSYDLKLKPEEVAQQTIISASIYATNYQGNSGRDGWTTRSTYVGPAIGLPLHESFANGTHKSGVWSGESIEETKVLFQALWDTTTSEVSGIESQDGDDYMMALTTYEDNCGYRMRAPRISLEGASKPTLVFYYAYTEAAKTFDVEVLVDDQPVRTFRSMDLNPANTGKWIRVELPLDEFKSNKYIQIAFTGTSEVATPAFIVIDNISILDLKEHDLTLKSFVSPVKILPNIESELTVTVRNSGAKEVKGNDYDIVVKFNGEEVAREHGSNIAPDGESVFALLHTPVMTDPETSSYQAFIEYEADENMTDNNSEAVTVKVEMPDLPAPRGLEAWGADGSTLKWSAPNINEIPAEKVTETFDSYPAFSITDIGKWTTYDGDGCNTVIMASSMGVLEYPHIGEPMAWQVMDPDKALILHGAWFCRSGSQMLVSFQAARTATREVKSDDWLISPELNGRAQRITFFARAGMSAYAPEDMDIMYSTTGNKPEDFKPLVENVEVPYASDWVEFNYNLPEGTRYFALVHKSFNKLAILLDDVTYSPAGAEVPDAKLLGYYIYRDGVRLNEQPVENVTYIDSDVEDGKEYTYHVSAAWDLGESPVSNAAKVTAHAGLANVAGSTFSVSVRNRTIHIEGAEGSFATVFTPAGLTVGSAMLNPSADIAVGSGIYIVRVGNRAVKVAVK